MTRDQFRGSRFETVAYLKFATLHLKLGTYL
jgi:hypothetical protein